MISWSSNNWSFHHWSMISWSWSMVSWGSMNNWSMVSWSRSSVINWSWSISFLDWKSSWCNGSSSRLLITTIAMYRLRSSVGLTYNRSMYSSMGLVDRVTDSWSIALFDRLVVGLVSSNYSQESSTDKSLHVYSSKLCDQMMHV